VTNYG